MRFLHLLILVFIALSLCAQEDTTYLDYTFYEIRDSSEVAYKKIRFTHPDNKKIDIEEIYYLTGELYSRTWIRVRDKKDNMLLKRIFYKNTNLKEELKYNTHGLNGNIITKWANGRVKRSDYYKNNEFIKGECYDKFGNKVEHYPYKTAAMFPGGTKALNKFVSEKLIYPEKSLENYEEGIVKVMFLVDTLGKLQNLSCYTSGYESLDNEALRVVLEMPDWIPATYEGEKLITRMIIPIAFKIPYQH